MVAYYFYFIRSKLNKDFAKCFLIFTVIPEKPDAIRWEKLPGNQYMLNWTFLNYEYFKAGLDHHLTVCYDNDGREQCVEKVGANLVIEYGVSSSKKVATWPYAMLHFLIMKMGNGVDIC